MITISLGWLNSEGFSDHVVKSFKDEDAAFAYCKKHLENGHIVRINGVRFHRDFEDIDGADVKVISDVEVLEAIRESE